MDQSPKFSYLVQPPPNNELPQGLSPTSNSSNPPSPVTKPIGFNIAVGTQNSPLSVLAMHGNNDYEMIKGGAAKTIAGSKVT